MKQTNNGIIRRKKVKFAQVSSIALKDKKLSLRAKGLYAMIQNYVTIEDFIIYKDYLISISDDGKSSFNRAWDELKGNGYLVQYQMQDETGKIYYEYDLLDEPRVLSKEEKALFEQKEKNRIARNKRKIEARKLKIIPQAEVPPMGKPIVGSSTNGSSTNGSSTTINNTDINYTELNHTNNTTDLEPKGSVVDNTIKDLIETQTTLKLTPYQTKTVTTWEREKTIRAIAIYKEQGGLYFKLLQKIYKDGAISSLSNRQQTKAEQFVQMDNRPDDYWDDIDKLEAEHIKKKLANETY